MSDQEVFTNDEFYAMSRALEIHHSVFYAFWQMGKPCFVDDTDTAYVRFDQEGNFIKFAMNQKFWRKANFTTQQFIVCHEALHVILNHGARVRENRSIITNQALDIVVNHLIVNKFGINRDEIDNWKKLCWIDTLFPKRKDILQDGNFEYYYNLIKQEMKSKSGQGKGQGGSSGGESGGDQGESQGQIADDHDKSFVDGNDLEKVIEKLDENLNPEEKQSIKDMIEKHFQENTGEGSSKSRGTAAGGGWKFMEDPKKIQKKSKWETVIKKWVNNHIFVNAKDKEQWARVNRRFTFMQNSDFFIPSEMEVEDYDEKKIKIQVHFFLDTSGSCSGLASRFWKAANSLPEDRFDVKLFCFDTRVYKVDIEKKKLYGFGGTSFDIIENYIQAHLKESNNKYPEAVFMITDGYGNNVRPQYPDRWHIFLTDDNKRCFPSNCRFFELKDYE